MQEYYCIYLKREIESMPKRKTGDRLEKVVSSKITKQEFTFLQGQANGLYFAGLIELPTVSHAVRFIIKEWRETQIREGSYSIGDVRDSRDLRYEEYKRPM